MIAGKAEINVAAGPIPVARGTTGRSPDAPRALVLAVVALFFIWGGLTSLNDVLIPKLKGLFSLSYTEAMLTQFAFFMAYFLVSLPAGNLIARVGYLSGIVIGLGTMAVGCLMFIPAASSGIYATFLVALFVLAAGITILQVAANPLIANMGSSATASSRLTLAQAFNSLGTTIFPPIGGAIILGSMAAVDPASLPQLERQAFLAREGAVIGNAYLVIAAILVAAALFFWMRRAQLPASREQAISLSGSLGLLRQPRLRGGVIALFLYVGAEVAIGSMLINYLSQASILGVSEQGAAGLIALYWGRDGRPVYRCGRAAAGIAGTGAGGSGSRGSAAGVCVRPDQRTAGRLCSARRRADELDHVPHDLFTGHARAGCPHAAGLWPVVHGHRRRRDHPDAVRCHRGCKHAVSRAGNPHRVLHRGCRLWLAMQRATRVTHCRTGRTVRSAGAGWQRVAAGHQ